MTGNFLGIPEAKYRLWEPTQGTPPPPAAPIRVYGTKYGPRTGGYD